MTQDIKTYGDQQGVMSTLNTLHSRVPMWMIVGVLIIGVASIAVFSGGVAADTGDSETITSPEAATAGMIPLQSAEGFVCTPPGDVAGTPGDWSSMTNSQKAQHQTFLGGLLQTFLSFITLSGIPVFIVLYQLDGILEFFALGADTKQAIKQHQRNLWIAAAKVYLLPVLIFFTVESTNITASPCIDLVAWI